MSWEPEDGLVRLQGFIDRHESTIATPSERAAPAGEPQQNAAA